MSRIIKFCLSVSMVFVVIFLVVLLMVKRQSKKDDPTVPKVMAEQNIQTNPHAILMGRSEHSVELKRIKKYPERDTLISTNNSVIKQHATEKSAVDRILDSKNTYPSGDVLHALTPDDEPKLLEAYQSQSELTNMLALTWALAAVGGDNASFALKYTLTARLYEQTLNSKEFKVMCDTVKALGFIAYRSDDASTFLKQSLSDDSWLVNRYWHFSAQSTEDYANRAFKGLVLSALAISLSSEFPNVLSEYRSLEPSKVRDISGSVVTAAFYYEYGTEHGSKALLDHMVSPQAMENYSEWIKTENGKNWKQWGLSARSAKSAQQSKN